jgi:hypothetical protein
MVAMNDPAGLINEVRETQTIEIVSRKRIAQPRAGGAE